MKKYGGVLLICENTGNFLLLERTKQANYPKTWSLVSGGIEEGESPLEATKRELKEETQIDSTNIKFTLWKTQHDLGTPFYFYLGYCDEEFECVLDAENDDWGWFNMDNLPDPLFPTLYASLVDIF